MRIAIIDDDAFVITSLETILNAEADIEVVCTGHDGTCALSIFEQHEPDILLMDIQMQDLNGLDAASQILSKHHEARIVFLTTFADDAYIASALQMGAKGYLIKQEVATIAPALRSVMLGQSVMGSEVLDHMGRLVNQSTSHKHKSGQLKGRSSMLSGLSQREYEITELIAQGLDNREIAGNLFISEGTVRNHISTILTKLDLKNRTQLAILYYQT